MSETHVLILAAGKGSRMKSDKPKVLHQIAGQPMLSHVISAGRSLNPSKVQVIVGFGADQIRQTYGQDVEYISQDQQLGTGHAVNCAYEHISDSSIVVVLYGDVPLIQSETLETVVSEANENGLCLLTVELDDPTGYGRILRDEFGSVRGIVEQKDATLNQLDICEVNTGILACRGEQLKKWLSQLSNDNAAGEYYLTDIVGMAVEEGLSVVAVQPSEAWEVAGANSRQQLVELERLYQRILADRLLEQGATLIDPDRFDLRGTLRVGKDVCIDINSIFEGVVTLGDRVTVGPNCVIRDAKIGDDVVINAYSHIEGAVIGSQSQIGPFARIREGTELAEKVKIGNFVETKKARLGEGAKASHLSYLGDAEVGPETNVGAGTITCNYDGKNKHKTIIGKDVFVGSNTAIVAPVEVADGATIAAGSVITKDVDENSLAIAREKQRNIKNWRD